MTVSGTAYVVDLSGRSAADGVGDTDPVYANLVNSLVQGQEVDQVGPEGILAGDCGLLASALSRVAMTHWSNGEQRLTHSALQGP